MLSPLDAIPSTVSTLPKNKTILRFHTLPTGQQETINILDVYHVIITACELRVVLSVQPGYISISFEKIRWRIGFLLSLQSRLTLLCVVEPSYTVQLSQDWRDLESCLQTPF